MSFNINRSSGQADAAHGHEQHGQEKTGDRMGVVNWVHGKIPFFTNGIVAAAFRHPGMPEFMQADGKHPANYHDSKNSHGNRLPEPADFGSGKGICRWWRAVDLEGVSVSVCWLSWLK